MPAFETIYRNSQGFRHLHTPALLLPGSAIRNSDTGQISSARWFFDSVWGMVLATAGHCGVEGNRFSFTDAKGEEHPFGEVVFSAYHDKEDLGVSDYALIKIDYAELLGSYVPFDPRIAPIQWQMPGQSTGNFSQMDGVFGLGFRSGLSCGPYNHTGQNGELYFRRISDQGDSGGPVFGIAGRTLIPLGFGSAGRDDDATLLLNQAIDTIIEEHSLVLLLEDS